MPRKFLPFIFSVFISTLCYTQINFKDISLQQALAQSVEQNKPVLFMAYTTWCPHCEKMIADVFTDSAVADYYNKNFICIKQDMEKGDGQNLAKKFGIASFPTFVFMDSTGLVLYQTVGEFKPADFIEQGKNSFITEKQFPYLKKQFQNNPGDSTACYQYLLALSRAHIDAMKIVDVYFNMHKNNFEFSPINWKILNISVSDIESEEFKFMIDNRKQFAAVVTQNRVDRKLYKTAAYNLQNAANVNDTATYFRKRKIAEQLNLFAVDSLLFTLDINLYERNNKWNAYAQTALAGTEKYVWNSYADLAHIGDDFLKNISDVPALTTAAGWVKHATEIRPEYGNTLLYAKLLFATGDKAAAKLAAINAKNIAMQTQSDTTEADALIKQSNE